MEINFAQRHISMNVRELADFRLGPGYQSSKRSLNRALLGQAWHTTLQERTRELNPKALFEVPIEATLGHRGWKVTVEGRIDQILPTPTALLFREVKSVSHPLPLSPQFLLERYPQYLCQAVTYAILARSLPQYKDQVLEPELYFVDVQTGITQSLPLGPGDEGIFFTQLEILVAYAERAYWRHERFKATTLNLPYIELRPEQTQLLNSLQSLPQTPTIHMLEAPTGFGKTGVTGYWALDALKQGAYDRLIFLTSKTTGQLTALQAFRAILPQESPIKMQAFRSRHEHAIRSPLHTCDSMGLLCNEGLEAHWQRAKIDLVDLFEDDLFSVETAKRLGEKTGVCPYALSRAALSLADVWIADYNYVFSPNHRGIFENQVAYSPKRTLLIIDEAHNLPSRVADSLSSVHKYLEAVQTLEELKLGDVPPMLSAVWERWVQFLERLEATDKLEEAAILELLDLAESLSEQIERSLSTPVELPGETRLRLWQAADIRSFLIDQRFEKLIHVPETGHLALTCLDARRVIRPTLESYARVLLMSATMSPMPDFMDSCGLKPAAVQTLSAECPWRAPAYDVVLDRRVDTRYKLRPQAYAVTAQTLIQLQKAAKSGQPVVGFFPSYAYATAVYEALRDKSHELEVALQWSEAGTDSSSFVSAALERSHILLLVLGSRFAESIDALGGRVEYALVAGPGLPAMSASEEATRQLFMPQGEKAAFRKVYQVPALRKVHQALGRLVRLPHHRSRIILHCQRFGERDYQGLLDPVYAPASTIENEAQLLQWIHKGKD